MNYANLEEAFAFYNEGALPEEEEILPIVETIPQGVLPSPEISQGGLCCCGDKSSFDINHAIIILLLVIIFFKK